MSKTTTLSFAATATATFGAGVATQPKATRTPGELVDALHAAFGHHPARAVHAKGIILVGAFEPDPHAASLTRAPHLQRTASKLIIRFSDFTGVPDIADNNAGANPRGIALRFTLPDGGSTDLVAHTFNGFPTATSDEFHDLLMAIATSGPTAAKPTPLDTFLGAHPIARTFLTTQKTPASYASISYFGVNSFQVTNQAGVSRYIRYQLVPESGEHTLTAGEAAQLDANYLQDEIKARVAARPFRFTLYAQLAEHGDRIEDPSIAWSDTRARVVLGTITVSSLAVNTPEQDKSLAFNPNNLPDGITIADPMLELRARAYPVSASERQ
jgi:catalase